MKDNLRMGICMGQGNFINNKKNRIIEGVWVKGKLRRDDEENKEDMRNQDLRVDSDAGPCDYQIKVTKPDDEVDGNFNKIETNPKVKVSE